MKCLNCGREGAYVRNVYEEGTKNKIGKEIYCRMCDTATPIEKEKE